MKKLMLIIFTFVYSVALGQNPEAHLHINILNDSKTLFVIDTSLFKGQYKSNLPQKLYSLNGEFTIVLHAINNNHFSSITRDDYIRYKKNFHKLPDDVNSSFDQFLGFSGSSDIEIINNRGPQKMDVIIQNITSPTYVNITYKKGTYTYDLKKTNVTNDPDITIETQQPKLYYGVQDRSLRELYPWLYYRLNPDSININYRAITFPNTQTTNLLTRSHSIYSKGPCFSPDSSDSVCFKILRMDILYQGRKKGAKISRPWIQDTATAKLLYSFTGKDTLAFDAVFSTVKYNGNYFIIAFPNHDEWEDFTPPLNSKGYFLYTPIAFRVDTVNWALKRMTYNPKLSLAGFSKAKIIIFDGTKYGLQFHAPFVFSDRLNQFVFGSFTSANRRKAHRAAHNSASR